MQEFNQGNQATEDEEERRLRRQIQIIKEECGVNEINRLGNLIIIIIAISVLTGVVIYGMHIYHRNQQVKQFTQFIDEINKQTKIEQKKINERPKNNNILNIIPSKIVNVNPPDYPQSAIKRNKQGVVVVRVTQDEKRKKIVKLVNSGNDRDLDEAALNAGRRAVIINAETPTGAIPVAYQFEVHFTIQQKSVIQKKYGIVEIKNIQKIN
ncbi:MAG: TonB family protein [Neisseriaceae bacterium]|nr:TonB family protein [Neisseriaceae bacterium]